MNSKKFFDSGINFSLDQPDSSVNRIGEIDDIQDINEDDDPEEVDEEEHFFSGDEKSFEDEFDWDAIEDFDDVDEPDLSHNIKSYHVTARGKISRDQRARQIASELINQYDWGIQNLDLLQQVFYENGWAAARIAIEKELARGLTPEELELAVFIRTLWTENQQYWISFIHISSNQPAQQTRAAYKRMSWREALRIIRVFNYTPSEDEIHLFIDNIYDDWYCSPSLQKHYK